MSSVRNSDVDKTPRAVESEVNVLGTVLMWDGVSEFLHVDLPSFLASLEPQDFLDSRHQRFWWSCLDLQKRGTPIDYITIARNLNRVEKLEPGDCAYLTWITAEYIPYHADYHAKLVKDTATQRKNLKSLGKAAQAVYQSDDKVVAESLREIQVKRTNLKAIDL